MKLKDKVVLVTGGAQGIGKEICLTCAREGAKIIVNYVNLVIIKKLLKQLIRIRSNRCDCYVSSS